MDDTAQALQDKLKQRRKAMEMTLHTSGETSKNTTIVDNDSDDDDDDIPALEDKLEEIEEEEEVTASRLKEKLESRHDATRRRLQRSEIHAPPPQISRPPVSRGQESPRSTPAPSAGQSQEFATPRSDFDSTLGSTLGRSTGTKSLRSRLQEKLQAAKQQRSMSPMAEERKRTQRLKDRISSSTRFDPLRSLSRPELEKERDLESKIAAKLHWRKIIQKAKQQTGQPTANECYDFFTKQFEEAPPDAEAPTTPPPEEESTEPPAEEREGEERETEEPAVEAVEEQPEVAEEAVAEEEAPETEEEEKKFLKDIIPEELDFKLFHLTAAEYVSHRIQVEDEQKLSFVPSLLDAPAESKVLDNNAPVYLEEEGFYVGLMPEIQIRNRNILENRIISQENLDHKAWFGPDGRVKILLNPVRMSATKPWVSGLEEIDPSIETVYVKAYESSVEDKYLQGAEEYELQVDVGSVVFHHHPLMSREHVLASKLNELYEAYVKHRHKNYAVFYHEKLRTLRLALRTMKRNSAATQGDDLSAIGGQELRIQDYVTEIRRTCNQRDKTENYERELIRNIVAEWAEIKKLRTFQNFSNTSVKLTVKKQEVNQDNDRAEWMHEIDAQVEECAEEYNYTVHHPYRKLMAEYQNNFQEWKKTRIKLKKQQQRAAALSGESDIPTSSADEEVVVGANPKPLKPLPPAKFDENATRERLIAQALSHRRNPGEPKISLEVTNTGVMTPDHQVPEGEAARRRALQNSALIAKVKFNGRDVCTSERKSITADFRVHFGQIFKIFITQWPDSIKVQLCEPGRLSSVLLDEVNLAIPDGSVNSANAQIFPAEFTSDRIITHPNHEGVGSSTPFSLRSDASSPPVSLKTRGQLFLSIAWGLTDDGRVLAPKILTHHSVDPVEGLSRQQAQQNVNEDTDLSTLWSQEGRLDPNDPANLGLVAFTNVKDGFAPTMDFFRLDHLQEQFNFTSEEEFINTRRFKVLIYRTKGIAEFRNLSMIPANEHEILDSAFTAYERRKREKDALGEVGEQKVAAGTLSAHRLEVLRFRQRVRDSVLRRFYTARRYHTLQDMVIEEQVPDIGTLGVNLLKIVEPRRPLKPIRSERKKATSQNLTEGSVSILVSVARAYNLPIREKQPGLEGSLSRAVLGSTSQQLQGGDSEPYKLSPFVSVSFQGNVKTTSIAQGPNPSWNEEMQLPFSATNNDYSPEVLQTIDDTLFIHIFDRVVTDANVDNRDRNDIGESSGVATGVVSHRIQNHWLGSLKIPFSTIYQRGKIDGTFKLNIPIMLLGYTTERGVTDGSAGNLQQPNSLDPYTQMQSQFLQPQEGSYLSVFVTLEPELGRPEPVPQKFETQEDPKLIDDALKYLEECKNKFPKRRVKTTVIDIKGESVFITRYVRPLPPPPSLVEGSSRDSLITAQRLARYVSLIPFVSDNVIYAGTCDLWSTCDQFLNMLCGDEEEHALLLLNYFLHIGKQAYLVLGNAIPEGDTAYVLTLEMSQEYLLWNASTGQHYNTSDGLCPLQAVHALVNQDNVWFNMQVHDLPSRMTFNVTTNGWKPLFRSTTVAQGLPSVQPEALVYPENDINYVKNLEARIERVLKDSIMEWRPRHVTRWNRHVGNTLREILETLEIDRWRTQVSVEDGGALSSSRQNILPGDHTRKLTSQIGDARFVGFPMDMPFTDIDAIVKAVRSTEVHKIQDNDIEFSLAVHIHPYPASVFCVWVYVAAISNRRAY